MQKGKNMNENIKKFIQKVAADESLQAKMKSFTDLDKAYEYAITIQDGYTKEEFSEVMSKLSKNIPDADELSDDDLASVAGGVTTSEDSLGVATATATLSVLSCAAAATAF